jgi:hypothetical protein
MARITRLKRRGRLTPWEVSWRDPNGQDNRKGFATENEARDWSEKITADPALGIRPPRKPRNRDIAVGIGFIGQRQFPRRYTREPYTQWLARWTEPNGQRRERGFPTEAETRAWLERITADPSLGTGKRLEQAIKVARRKRYGRTAKPPAVESAAAEAAVMRQAQRSDRQLLDALAAIERKLGQDRHAGQLGEIKGLLRDNLLRRLTAIERQLGLVEQPQTPRINRRRPLE